LPLMEFGVPELQKLWPQAVYDESPLSLPAEEA
jgi:hypothetical protein